MKERTSLGGLDYIKIVAAFLVVAIHTSPLSSFSSEGDFLLTRVIARMAVPFFLMVTGYFLLPFCVDEKNNNTEFSHVLTFIKKISLLYLVATILYLPVGIYAGQYDTNNPFNFFKMFLIDGTFYHLWYFPAVITGILVVYLLSRKLSLHWIVAISILLYAIGLFGDSYYGITENIPFLTFIYKGIFHLSSYTRNGLFYAPVFLVMGAWFGLKDRCFIKKVSVTGLLLFLMLMTIEALLLRHFTTQRHDSMYVALIPVMFFLFQVVIRITCAPIKAVRSYSTWIYILHPLMIIVVRGGSKLVGVSTIFVDNSMLHYLAVCLATGISAIPFVWYMMRRSQEEFSKGRAWIEINRDALESNVRELQALLPEKCALMPAIKADAYGHGAVLIARELSKMNIKAFCVATVMEGVKLRKNKIKGEILILGYTHPKHFYLLRRYDLMQTVIDYSYAVLLNDFGKKIKVHIGVDTGMHRLGERVENREKIIHMFRMKNLEIDGIYTHFCSADSLNPKHIEYTRNQEFALRKLVEDLEKAGFTGQKIHLQASYGLLNYPEMTGDYARIGIAIYGTLSQEMDQSTCNLPLKPVLALKARIAVVKTLKAGEGAGYGLQYVAKLDRKIAVLSIGYGDGLPPKLGMSRGNVLINGKIAPIIGRICMDQTLIDITEIPDVKSGSIAVLIGKSGNKEIRVAELAKQTNTITNEIVSRLGERLERMVIREGDEYITQ